MQFLLREIIANISTFILVNIINHDNFFIIRKFKMIKKTIKQYQTKFGNKSVEKINKFLVFELI